MLENLKQPVGIFDAGIGSYDIVRKIRAAYPAQDTVYLADRASFPYGAKSEDELEDSIFRAVDYLTGLGVGAIILASNAPTITVLPRLLPRFRLPVLGVYPPIRAALEGVGADGVVAVIGARVLTDSAALRDYVAGEAGGGSSDRVAFAEAGGLIELVETGTFLSDPATTQRTVSDFVEALQQRHPRLAGITLSSTHLPWLKQFFEQADPRLKLFDPADEVTEQFRPLVTAGSGKLVTLVTQSPQHPFHEFQATLDRLTLDLQPRLVQI
ncbi:glutamate racemase [Deinococcus marmoris]|uniref:glutamate racemase n=1 Tax=Deinococcus marmoris TaxID=249408 RepID=UPI0004963FB6|nr:aspartate/glutamate racemase family protein [Deinococcus marmoris]